jgi:hypothetical protein
MRIAEAYSDGFRCAQPIVRACTLLCAFLLAPLADAQESGPLVLAKASYFFVGGRIDSSVEGSPMVGQMYVDRMPGPTRPDRAQRAVP